MESLDTTAQREECLQKATSAQEAYDQFLAECQELGPKLELYPSSMNREWEVLPEHSVLFVDEIDPVTGDVSDVTGEVERYGD